MQIPHFDTNTTLFVLFLSALAFSYGYFLIVDRSDRNMVINLQLREIEVRFSEAEDIYRDCVSLSKAGVSAPSSVRSGCIESRSFVLWARTFPFDPKLSDMRREFLTLARMLEEMTGALAVRPTSEVGLRLLEKIPAQMVNVENKIIGAKQWWRLVL